MIPGILRYEWIKARSIRRTWALAIAVVAVTVLSMMISLSGQLGGGDMQPPDAWDPTARSLAGILGGQLLMGLLGASIVTSEYATGTITATLAVAPHRRQLLAAKAAVTALLASATSVAAIATSFTVGQIAIGAAGLPQADATDPRVIRALLCAAGYLTLTALIGLAFGTITRSSLGAFAVIVSVALVAPGILPALPDPIGGAMSTYWPTTAGQSSYAVLFQGGLPMPFGLGVMTLFTIYSTVASHLVFGIRDA